MELPRLSLLKSLGCNASDEVFGCLCIEETLSSKGFIAKSLAKIGFELIVRYLFAQRLKEFW